MTMVRGWAMKPASSSSEKAAREGASIPRWHSSSSVTGTRAASPKIMPRADRCPSESWPTFVPRGIRKRSTSASA